LVRKARMLARDFQDGIDEVVREADLDDMKKKLDGLSDSDITKTIEDTLDPTGGIAADLDMTEIEKDLSKTANDAAKPVAKSAEISDAAPSDPETLIPEAADSAPAPSDPETLIPEAADSAPAPDPEKKA